MNDNFESYSLGNLNGQGGWSGSNSMQVVSTPTNTGSRAVSFGNTAEGIITKSIDAVAQGKVIFYIRFTSTNSGRIVGIMTGTTQVADIRVSSGVIGFRQGGGTHTLEGSPNVNTWYKCELEWDNTQGVRARLNDGSFSSWLPPLNSFSTINNIRVSNFSSVTGDQYVDDFSGSNQEFQEELSVTAIATPLMTDIASFLKTMTVVAEASVSIVRSITKTIQVTAEATTELFKGLYKDILVDAIATPTLTTGRLLLQELTTTASATVSITKQEVTLVLLEVTAQATASVVMIKSYLMEIAVTAEATISQASAYTISKIIEVTASATVSITKGLVLSMELIVTAVGVATTTIQKALSMTISVIASGIARLVRDFGYTDKYPRNEVDYEDKYPTNSEY